MKITRCELLREELGGTELGPCEPIKVKGAGNKEEVIYSLNNILNLTMPGTV